MGSIEPRKMEDLYRAFEKADFVVRKRYRENMGNYNICDLPKWMEDAFDVSTTEKKIPIGDNVQFFRIKKLVYDMQENVWDKLTTVYHTMSAFENTSVLMLLKSDGITVQLYLGVAERGVGESSHAKIETKMRGDKLETLKTSFEANFPGSTIEENDLIEEIKDGKTTLLSKPIDKKELIKSIFDGAVSVSSVSGTASLRNDEAHDNKKFIQGMEKLVDAMKGKAFTAIFIADCKSICEIEQICADYEDIYSVLSPFAQSQQTIGKTACETETESFIEGVARTTNRSVAESVSHTHSVGTSTSNSVGGSASVGVGPVHASANYQHQWGKNEGDADQKGSTETTGTAESLTTQNSTAKSISTSTNDGLQITIQNRAVKTLMDRIDEQLKHLRSCESFGIFEFGCYFVASETAIARTAASVYDALMRGEESGAEVSSVCTWTDDENNGHKDDAKRAIKYLKLFYHPLVAIPNLSEAEADKQYKIMPIPPTTIISGKEIAIQMGLPKKALPGVSVTECAEFGRNADSAGKSSINVGCVYHMHTAEFERAVKLNTDLLTSHVFITGSTGSGKSNTVYQLLDKLSGDGKTFLVVEPTKGEYKTVFGGRDNVAVYGTNYKHTRLLRINPFSFPKGVPLYAHLDRLIEIFNACWPMYAAMPAVLKDAIERAYVEAGWDLQTSENEKYGRLFPTFADVLRQIDIVMNESDYSGDSKGDYKGALKTRLKSLTNGIFRTVFGCDEIPDCDLFDKNVIVDLSEIGPETTSLIMGMLVLKLQEYRMTSGIMNSPLHHVTVLEEAHNLLKRTSTEQTAEGSNLVGKSVEMLTNAIAEMRTYGECFMIVDQAPGALDPAAIRNTNTKIVLRLPDFSDRELVGKAIGLNDYQIVELSRLERGVAAVYQSGWIESVLCRFEEFKKENMSPLEGEGEQVKPDHSVAILLKNVLLGTQNRELVSSLKNLKNSIVYKSSLPLSVKQTVSNACEGDLENSKLAAIAYELLDADSLNLTDGSREEAVAYRLYQLMQRNHIDKQNMDTINLDMLVEILNEERQRRESDWRSMWSGGIR